MRRLMIAVLALAACGDDGNNGIPPDGAVDGLDVDAEVFPDAPDGSDLLVVPPDCAAGRVTADRADDWSGDQIRYLYVVPSDGVDRQYDTNGKICNSVRAVATWFHGQTGDSYLRLDTAGGLLDIGFVRLAKTDVQMRGNDPNNTSIDTGTAFVRERIERELIAMGMIASNKLYGVYYDGTSVYSCGGGAYPPLIKARVGAMYLKAIPTGQSQECGAVLPWGQPSLVPNYVDYGILHELTHSMGIVASTSPNQHSSGHVYDALQTKPNTDLMYSPRPGMNDPGWATTSGLKIDLGGDDYYGCCDVDLKTMSLLSPLPANAHRPNGW